MAKINIKICQNIIPIRKEYINYHINKYEDYIEVYDYNDKLIARFFDKNACEQILSGYSTIMESVCADYSESNNFDKSAYIDDPDEPDEDDVEDWK